MDVPKVLRRYVDLREAAQTHLAKEGAAGKGVRALTLRQICEALDVEMIGEEHCGLDDSWMVLMATQALLLKGAQLAEIDLDIERETFFSSSSIEQSLCLDGIP